MIKQPKILAFHLPQFHSFKENDDWWGKDFTEWVNVKKAKKLFESHNQPREPLNGYYNLLNYETRKMQCQLAKEYGIYGFCYYHYWFNGKLLMEKPLEALLEEKELDLPFCFCWANENWTRAWDGKTSDVLISQKYGDKDDWDNHFEYLNKFFKDTRYIKISNSPVLLIYRTKDIEKLDEMIKYWDDKCKENGFDGIYIVEELNGFQNNSQTKFSKAIVDFEPAFTQRFGKNKIGKLNDKIKYFFEEKIFGKNYFIFDYDKIWRKILNRKYNKIEKEKIFLGAFVDWDNSPRRKKGAKIFKNVSVLKFKNYFSQLYEKAKIMDSDYIFINAWNEWAEGTYLEPDKKNKYGYLESINEIIERNTKGNKNE